MYTNINVNSPSSFSLSLPEKKRKSIIILAYKTFLFLFHHIIGIFPHLILLGSNLFCRKHIVASWRDDFNCMFIWVVFEKYVFTTKHSYVVGGVGGGGSFDIFIYCIFYNILSVAFFVHI